MLRRFGWFACLFAAPAAAFDAAPLFQRLTVADGLPSSQVYEAAVDRDGYVWFATADGLARWDGIEFRVYRHDPSDPDSLPANDVETVLVDRLNRVWIGAEDGGLSMLDGARTGFRQWRHDPRLAGTLSGDNVWSLAESGDGTLWIGTYAAGINRLGSDGALANWRHVDGDATTLAADDVTALAFDRTGNLWVATSAGLTRLAAESLSGARPHADRQLLAGQLVVSVRADRDGRLWIGTRDAAYRMDPSATEPERIELAVQTPVVEGVAVDARGDAWIATHRGLLRRDSAGRVQAHRLIPGLAFGLPGNVVMDVAEDREGGLWFSLLGAGVARLPPHWRNFSWLRADEVDPAEAGDGFVAAFAVCADGSVWQSRPTGALLRFDPAGGAPARLLEGVQVPGRRWHAMHCDRDGAIWLGHRFGLARLRTPKAELEMWTASDADTAALASGMVTRLAEGSDGALWVGASGAGLHRVDRASGAVRRFRPDDGGPRSSEIEALAFDGAGRLWVGGNGGVDRHDPVRDAFEPITEVPAGRVDGLAFAADGSVWLHTLDQLLHARVDGTRLHALQLIDARGGLPIARMAGLVLAADGTLWLPGARGLARYDPARGDFRVYGRADGLADVELGARAPQRDAAGRIVLAAPLGVVAFDVAALRDNDVAPALALHELSVLRDGARVALDPAQAIRLGYRDRDLRVGIRALSLADPSANRYRFRLDGYDPDWFEVQARGERVFSQLPSGSYELALAGSNANGVWNAAPLRLPIVVDAPPWRRPAAYASYAALLVLLGLGALRWYRVRLERRHALALADERRGAAERESRAKSEFLADIGHEIRTPMSGLLGMTELLLRTPLDRRQQGYARTVLRSGQHLLQLINDLLDLSRIEAGKLVLEPAPCAIDALVDDVIALEAPLAADKKLDLYGGVGAEVPVVMADARRLKQVLLNLVNNALKFTERGRVTLAAALDPAREHGLEFVVTDTGPGMSADTVRQLFGRYAQGEVPAALRRGGSGLGLAIARHLVELMGGSISVDSVPGSGSRFRVQLALPPAAAGTQPQPVPLPALPSAARRVLVVEDDGVTREVVVELLRASGHAVDAGANGLDALRMLDEHRYDAALIDLDLPGVDGFRLVRMLRKREAPHAPRLHAIAISARTAPDTEAACVEAGFDAFLRKPLSGQQLDAALAAPAHRPLKPAG